MSAFHACVEKKVWLACIFEYEYTVALLLVCW